MVNVIEDEWQCRRCNHRMADHVLHANHCLDCDCPAFLLKSDDFKTVKKIKGDYYRSKETNLLKKLGMYLRIIK